MLQIWHSLRYLNIYGVILIIFDQKISHRSTPALIYKPRSRLTLPNHAQNHILIWVDIYKEKHLNL